MNEYLYRIRPTRPEMLQRATEEEARIVGQHFAYLQELCRDGRVRMAGRTAGAGPETFGIVVFRASSDEEANALMEEDPAVKQGVMSAELFPFRVALWTEAP